MRKQILPLLLTGAAALAQTPAPTATFEVASIRPAAPMQEGRMLVSMRGGPGTPDPTQLTWTNISMMNVVTTAYNVKSYQITGPAESQLNSDRYDISARIAPGATKEQYRQMLQNLLAERFHLVLHHESKEFSGYELAIAKGGSKLKEASPEDAAYDPAKDTTPRTGGPPQRDAKGNVQMDRPGLMMMMNMGPNGVMTSKLTSRAQTISQLLETIGSQLNRPVVDKTGLTGKYDYTLEFAPDMNSGMMMKGMAMPPMPTPPAGGAGPERAAPANDDSAPTLVTALQQQLGLRLDSKKVTLDVLVIEKVDKTPTEN